MVLTFALALVASLVAYLVACLGAVLVLLAVALRPHQGARLVGWANDAPSRSAARRRKRGTATLSALLLALGWLASERAAATSTPAPAPHDGEVELPLAEYLALVDRASAAARARAAREAAAPSHAEVVSQHTSLSVEGSELAVSATYEVLVQGQPRAPLPLPFPGFAGTVEVRAGGAPAGAPAAGAAVTARPGGGLLLVAPAAGRYQVTVRGRAPVTTSGGIGRLAVPAPAAPIATLDLDLPAEMAWSAPGAVLVREVVAGPRRHLRLSPRRAPEGGGEQVVELRRRFDDAEAERLLARAVSLTLVELREEGPRRHDVVLYEVARGALPSFTVELPPGLAPVGAASDEGAAVPVIEGSHLTVHRRRQLQGTGYLVLTSLPAAPDALPLAAPRPLHGGSPVEVRAHYVAVASTLAGEARPVPESAWSRVDLDDLPPLLREALQAVDLTAAWRQVAPTEQARLAVAHLAPAARLATAVRHRETTTLLTVDGTLVHRDRFTLAAAAVAAGGALEVALPAGAVLWSARVGEQPVRPLRRETDAMVLVPLGFAAGAETTVEVVAVQERALPAGRSRLALELPAVVVPVLEHRWRLLLPERARYRFRAGDLRPAREETLRSDGVMITDIAAIGSSPRYYDFDSYGEAGTVAHGPGGDGAVLGTVTDTEGHPLPGATVTLTSPSLPRPLVQITDAQGHFLVVSLPAGDYALRAELEGFSRIDYPRVRATAGRRTMVEVAMGAAVEDVITVTAERPLLDRHRVSTGANVSSTELEKIPTARDAWQGAALYAQNVEELRQGLVGGVKPLPVEIPESGKFLLLTGVLPPARVSVELDVRAGR